MHCVTCPLHRRTGLPLTWLVGLLFMLLTGASAPAFGQAEPQTLQAEARQYGLALVWASVRENYVNYDRMPIDWDSAFVATMGEVAGAESTYAYYRILKRLVAAIEDGHTKVSMPRDVRAAEARNFPLRTRLIEGRVVVTQVRNDSLYRIGIRPGMAVRTIDGEDAVAYGRMHVMPYEAASTVQDRLLRTYDYELFRGPADRPVRLTLVDRNGQTMDVEASRRLPWNRTVRRPLVDWQVLPGNIGHLTLNGFDNRRFYADFDSVYAELLNTDALIIDIRNNGGGTSTYGYYVLSHLVDRRFYGTYWVSRQYVPKLEAGAPSVDYFMQRRRHYAPAEAEKYRNPVVLLIGEATFSAAEDFAVTFDHLDRGEIIGGPSGGSSGQPLVVQLPGGGRLRVCTERNTYPDGREFVGIGVVPDVAVAPTVKGVAAGQDEVLQAALERLSRR